MYIFAIVGGFVSTLGSIELVFGSVYTLGSDVLCFGLVWLFTDDDGLVGGSGTISFRNIGGIALFNNFAISINSLLVLSPYLRLVIFNCGDLMMSRRYVAACLKYVSGVMARKGIFCGTNSTSAFLVAPCSDMKHL